MMIMFFIIFNILLMLILILLMLILVLFLMILLLLMIVMPLVQYSDDFEMRSMKPNFFSGAIYILVHLYSIFAYSYGLWKSYNI